MCCCLFIVSELLCHSLPDFPAFTSVIDEAPVLNSKAFFPVRINVTAGKCMQFKYTGIIYIVWGIKAGVGSSAEVDADISD